jgi:hypothetical protein
MIRAFNHHRRLVSDPMTEAYREQPSDWLAVPMTTVLVVVLTIVWAVS